MDIDYESLASSEFTITAPADGAQCTYRLRAMDAHMQMLLPRKMAKAFERTLGRPAETDAEVHEWFSDWVEDTVEGQAFLMDAAFAPLGDSPALSSVMSQGPLSGDDLAKIIFGQKSFTASAPASSSKRPGTGKRSPKPAGPTRKGTMTVVRGNTRASTSRKGR